MAANRLPLIVTIPHSGEKVPPQTPWLNHLSEQVLMCDVDRFVDKLYVPALEELGVPFVKTEWHRYAADLNRIPQDIDSSSVKGDHNPQGMHSRGFHWVYTTHKQSLMTAPMDPEIHEELVKLIYEPFHESVRKEYSSLRGLGYQNIFHIDAHSMPSRGTSEHRDPGEYRAEVVISDCKGKSCDRRFRDLVIAAYVVAGFKVGYNWPYFGGRVTEQYGIPGLGQHAIQVELNRSIYMDEVSKKMNLEDSKKIQEKLKLAMSYICSNIQSVM